jgi:hypothetical protein
LRQIGDLLAARRHELAALVHNLGTLSSATNAKDTQLATVIDAGDRTVSALAGQDPELRDSIQRLPGTLSTARSTLADLGTLSNVLGPTATALLPTARNLPATLRHTRTLFQGAALLPLDEIPPFVDAVTPLARKLPGLQSNLRQAVPALIKSFKVLDYTTNEIAYNAGGRNPGFLYWLSWFVHNADSFIGNSDANGPVWRSIVLTSCAGLKSLSLGQLIETVLGTNFGC